MTRYWVGKEPWRWCIGQSIGPCSNPSTSGKPILRYQIRPIYKRHKSNTVLPDQLNPRSPDLHLWLLRDSSFQHQAQGPGLDRPDCDLQGRQHNRVSSDEVRILRRNGHQQDGRQDHELQRHLQLRPQPLLRPRRPDAAANEGQRPERYVRQKHLSSHDPRLSCDVLAPYPQVKEQLAEVGWRLPGQAWEGGRLSSLGLWTA